MKVSSSFLGVSIRAWVVLMVVVTMCIMAYRQVKIEEPFYSVIIMVVSFYFGKESALNPKPPVT